MRPPTCRSAEPDGGPRLFPRAKQVIPKWKARGTTSWSTHSNQHRRSCAKAQGYRANIKPLRPPTSDLIESGRRGRGVAILNPEAADEVDDAKE